MSDWSDSVLAAEATKAGSASVIIRLIPRPPSRTDRLACIHWAVCWMECLTSPSNLPREGWSADGQHRRRWRTFGALNDDLSRIKASWAPMALSLSTALARSSHRSSHAVSGAAPGNRGAPNKVGWEQRAKRPLRENELQIKLKTNYTDRHQTTQTNQLDLQKPL